MSWSGVNENKSMRTRVAMLLKEKTEKCEKQNLINEKNYGLGKIVVGYMPNKDIKKEEKDKCFDELQLEVTKNQLVMIIGDLNGWVGNRNQMEEYMERNEGNIKNAYEYRILQKNKLKLGSAFFMYKDIYKITRDPEQKWVISDWLLFGK